MPAKRRSALWLRRSAALLLLLVAACGGGGDGGGGGPGPQPLTYTGNTNPATISATNAGALSASVVSGDNEVPNPLSSIAPADGGDALAGLGQGIARDARASVMENKVPSALSSAPVDATRSCINGGTRRMAGDITAGGTGTLQVIYTNCDVGDGKIFNGTVNVRIDAAVAVPGDFVPTDLTMTFSPMTVRGTVNGDLAGSMRFQLDIPAKTETVTENLVARQNNTGRMLMKENFRTIIVYNDMAAPTSLTAVVNGRIYDSVHGFVDIATTVPLVFATLTQQRPNGGQLVLTGANNARVRMNMLSANLVELQLDLDNNNVWEVTAIITWAQLSGQAGADIADSDGDGMHNSWETAVGLNPGVNDAAGDRDGDGATNLAEYRAGTAP